MAEQLTFSVVIPCRNEERNVVAITEAVITEMERLGDPFDLIFIDNASEDRTVPLIRDMCARDPRIRLIINARNFGQMRSPTHAIFQARGKAVISLCADFQDPPGLIGPFVDRWRDGADVVLGVRESEKSSLWLSATRPIAYRFAKTFGDVPIIPNATGFGLYDARVVRAIERLKEPEPFFRGMLVETAHRIDTVPYPRAPRAGGLSNNNFFALLDFSLSGIAGNSKKLVRVPFYIGAILLIACGVMGLVALTALLLERPFWGWALASLMELHFGMLFMFLGVVGDQVRMISERTRATPLVIERERVNFPANY